MFTGLIEEVGEIAGVTRSGNSINIKVRAASLFDDLKTDDSVAISGVCQTVTAVEGMYFYVTAVEETLKKTTFKELRNGTKVNLERALRLSDRLGGHIVQGHVDTTGKVRAIKLIEPAYLMTISYPREFGKYIVPVGSICIDGVSLTVAERGADTLTVSVIPHTWKMTTLQWLRVGSAVNLEFDIIGKYVENMMNHGGTRKGGRFGAIYRPTRFLNIYS
jgi:riboflavin synthase